MNEPAIDRGRVVGGWGNRESNILILGEAPGESEISTGIPFTGKAGELLERLLRDAGTTKESCYVTNVCKTRPPKNEFKWFRLKENREYLADQLISTRAEARTVNPHVILALGAEALACCIGDRRIGDRRGFVEWSTELGTKVIGTYHPAALLRNINLYPLALFDIRKAVEESKTKEYRASVRNITLGTEFGVTIERLRWIRNNCKKVAFDIETVAEGVDCISLAWAGDQAISIPIFTGAGNYWSVENEKEIWHEVKGILEDEGIGKIAQNGFYDSWWLARDYGIMVRPIQHDTMLAASLINSEFPKDLWTLASLYTDQPFWEDKHGDKLDDNRWRYNGTDSAVTWEIASKQSKELDDYGHRGFYTRLTMPLLPCLVRASLKGIRFDIKERDRLLEEATRGKREKVTELLKLTGEGFNYASYPQLCKYFIAGLKVKPHIDRKTKNPTFDDDALARLSKQYPDIKEFGILREIRGYDSDIKILKVTLSEDGRIRCSYNIAGTETGRLSSSDAPDRTGTNLQNISPRFRHLFLADEGCWLVKADLKQAENIMVAYLSGDPFMIGIIESGGDIHTQIASMIFKKPEKDITKQERQLGKKTGHAANYGMREKRLQEICLEEEGVVLKKSEAKDLLESYHNAFPKIRVWHKSIQGDLGRTRSIRNPFGRLRRFAGHWGDDLFREAYAFLPQGSIADSVAGSIIQLESKLDIRLQVHDEIVFNVPKFELDRTCRLIKETMEAPFKIEGRTVKIPVEIKYGDNWGRTEEWKP